MRLLLAPLLALAAYYGFASTLPSPNPNSYFSRLTTTVTSPPEVFRRTVAADLDGDGWQDLAMVRGTDVEVLMAPGAFESWSPNLATANDLATLPGSGGTDELVLVGANGAQRLSFAWVQQGQSWVESWSLTILEGSTWLGATHVAVRQVPGDASPRIYGVMSDGTSVRALIDSGSGYMDTALFDVGKTVHELAVMEWDGADPPEVAVTTPYDPALPGLLQRTSLLVYREDTQGAWGLHYSKKVAGFDTVAMAAGRQGSRPEEWIAWISSWNQDPDDEAYMVVDSFGASTAQWLPGDPLVAGLTAGDWDGDGNDDLVFGVRKDHSLVSLHNKGTTGPAFGTSVSSPPPPAIAEMTLLALGPSGPADDNEALATVADFDNDGENDLAYPVQSTGEIVVDRNTPPGPDPAPRIVPEADFWVDCDTGQLVFDLDDTQTWPAPIAQGANIQVRVEIGLFEKQAGQETDPDSIAVNMIPDASGENLVVSMSEPLGTDTLYFWILHFVDYDTVTGDIYRNHPDLIHGIQVDWYYTGSNEAPPGYNFLNEHASGPFFDVWRECYDTGVKVGNGAPVPTVPALPVNENPRFNWN